MTEDADTQDAGQLPEPVKFTIEVTSGLEETEDDFTRSWTLTADQWEDTAENIRLVLLSEVVGSAHGYAQLLMLQPDRFHRVTTTWRWHS